MQVLKGEERRSKDDARCVTAMGDIVGERGVGVGGEGERSGERGWMWLKASRRVPLLVRSFALPKSSAADDSDCEKEQNPQTPALK